MENQSQLITILKLQQEILGENNQMKRKFGREIDSVLDYTKITFNELDDTDKPLQPLQAFYNYDLIESEIDDFLEEYATVEEVPEGVSIQKVELCLSIYTRQDFKLEACCTDTNNEQYWVELNKQFINADEFVDLIPDYEKIRI